MMWLENDVSYSTESRNPDYEDPYRFESSMVIEDGLSTSMIVTVSVPRSSTTTIVGSKQEKSNITLFPTKIITNPSGLLSPEGFSL